MATGKHRRDFTCAIHRCVMCDDEGVGLKKDDDEVVQGVVAMMLKMGIMAAQPGAGDEDDDGERS